MGQYVPFDETELVGLNNFLAHFPVGDDPYPYHLPEGFYRSISLSDEFRHKKYLEVVGNPSNISDKRLNQTQHEFYTEVDATIREIEMDELEIRKTINIFIHDSRLEDCSDTEGLIKNLDGFLAPIYIALRKKGYNRGDLIA